MVDRESLDWGGGEGEKTPVDGTFIESNTGQNDFVQWMTGNETWELGNHGINPN
jgi:hypothetical protein